MLFHSWTNFDRRLVLNNTCLSDFYKCLHIKRQNSCRNIYKISLQWRHNGRNSVSNHQPHECLLNRLFRRRSKKTSKLRVTGLCAGNSPETGEFPAQMASNAENASIWWRHHGVINTSSELRSQQNNFPSNLNSGEILSVKWARGSKLGRPVFAEHVRGSIKSPRHLTKLRVAVIVGGYHVTIGYRSREFERDCMITMKHLTQLLGSLV